jgi:hypothetical protein
MEKFRLEQSSVKRAEFLIDLLDRIAYYLGLESDIWNKVGKMQRIAVTY